MRGTTTKTVRRERVPAFSACAYLAMVRVNSNRWRLDDDERLVLEVFAVHADAVGVVTLHPHDVPRLLGVDAAKVTDRRELRAVVAGFRDARASLVRGGWLLVRRLRGDAWRYRLTLPRGEPRERLEE